jgi:hypothetical protein
MLLNDGASSMEMRKATRINGRGNDRPITTQIAHVTWAMFPESWIDALEMRDVA